MKKILTALIVAFACTASVGEAVEIKYSAFQSGFMSIVSDFAQRYKGSENELKKSALVTERFRQFEKLKGDPRKIQDWVGVLEQVGTTSDGKAYVTIRLSPNLLSVSTWNNFFSDSGDRSLIPQQSPIYAKLSEMKVGNVVKFSGKLKRVKNLTEEGKMTSPDFLFSFTSIEKIGDRITD